MVRKTLMLETVDKVKSFVNIVTPCPYEIDLCSGRFVVNAKSMLGIFSLDMGKPVQVVIHSDDCRELLDHLEQFACQA